MNAAMQVMPGSAAENRPFNLSSAIGSWCPGCGKTFTMETQKQEGGTGGPKGQCAYCSFHKRANVIEKRATDSRIARSTSTKRRKCGRTSVKQSGNVGMPQVRIGSIL